MNCSTVIALTCSMYSCIFFGSFMSFSDGIDGGGSSCSASFIAVSILSPVAACCFARSRSRSESSSSRPSISIISPTAVWNFACTLRRLHAACSIVALSFPFTRSFAASSTAESTTSYGPCPVRSLSPLTLSRSFCRWSFGSVHRSATEVACGEKYAISCWSPSSQSSSDSSSSAAKSIVRDSRITREKHIHRASCRSPAVFFANVSVYGP